MEIINLTQHAASPEQRLAGVVEPHDKNEVCQLLTFTEIPAPEVLVFRAEKLVAIATQSGADQAMIGGAPFFMSTLERLLREKGIEPVYAFSKRESVEVVNENGEVVKTNVFKHTGFVRL